MSEGLKAKAEVKINKKFVTKLFPWGDWLIYTGQWTFLKFKYYFLALYFVFISLVRCRLRVLRTILMYLG